MNQAARFAVRLAAKGERSRSVAIVRARARPYQAGYRSLELAEVAGRTRHMPKEFIAGHCDVSDAYLEYVRPLVGRLPAMARL